MDIKVIAVSIIVLLLTGFLIYTGLFKLFYFDLTKSRWKKEKANYPLLARKLNLSFKPGELDYHIGEISGEFNGCQVAVKPDENATVEVRFKSTPDLFLSSIDPENTEVFPDMIRFDTQNAVVDQYFRTRFAVPAIASALSVNPRSLHSVEQVINKWARPIQRFDISRNGIECRFKYGGQTYIPTNVLDSLLPDLCRFAESVESLLPQANHSASENISD